MSQTFRVRAVTRRRALAITGVAAAALLAGCGDHDNWHATDVTGSLPALDFTMTRASDGKAVTATDYRGKVVLLYFGYTYCPDVCPMTLSNIATVLNRLGSQADAVRVLFVTVDPNRDTLPALDAYSKNFGPQVEGLRGTDDQVERLARRYRIVHSVTPAADGRPYEVSHSSAVYAFDATGAARLLISSLSQPEPPVADTEADLRQLIAQAEPGPLARLWSLV